MGISYCKCLLFKQWLIWCPASLVNDLEAQIIKSVVLPIDSVKGFLAADEGEALYQFALGEFSHLI